MKHLEEAGNITVFIHIDSISGGRLGQAWHCHNGSGQYDYEPGAGAYIDIPHI